MSRVGLLAFGSVALLIARRRFSSAPHAANYWRCQSVTEPDTIAQIKAAYNSLPADHLVNILGDGVAQQVFLADVVPEPSTICLAASAAIAIVWFRRRRTN